MRLSILYLRCTHMKRVSTGVEALDTFNSLFEMQYYRQHIETPPPYAFNSLFEMPHCSAPQAWRRGTATTFNSLFEMPSDRCGLRLLRRPLSLSILYLRCDTTANLRAMTAVPSSLSILYLRCINMRAHCVMTRRCGPFNSLFEMRLLHSSSSLATLATNFQFSI